VEKLDSGDYSIKEIPNLVIVEKKAHGLELYSNVIAFKERWLRQVERMRVYKIKYIVIQQTYNEFLNPDNWRPFSKKKSYILMSIVESWLIAMSQNENIHFVFAGQNGAARITKKILLKSYEWERKRLRNEKNSIEKST
jgi:hypothetical protein